MHPHRLTRLASGLALLLPLILLCQCGGISTGPDTGQSSPPAGIGRVLMIGDSLSVGSFGDSMEAYLTQKAGTQQVYFYASCGSSAQHWLSSTETFVTTCGYRETRPSVHILQKHRNGRHPPPEPTPKIERLLRQIRPDTVIIQLGTNHYDVFQRDGLAKLEEERGYFDAFARALSSSGARPSRIIWIMPPDSAKFSPSVEAIVERIILDTCRRHRIMPVRSKAMTQYVKGTTGGDGVHYAEKPGQDWAARVVRVINSWL